jgi:hypothetical protein
MLFQNVFEVLTLAIDRPDDQFVLFVASTP